MKKEKSKITFDFSVEERKEVEELFLLMNVKSRKDLVLTLIRKELERRRGQKDE